MTKLQQAQFQLLVEFDRICKLLDVNYFLVCGSALGAVKYSGIIPWDDDIDVGIYRPDYEKFIEKAPALLPENLFLQNWKTEPAFPQVFSKLRNSNTTFIESSASELPINHGIYIDIFPLDGYPTKRIEQLHLELFKRFYSSILLSCFSIPRSGLSSVLCYLYHCIGLQKHPARIAKKYEALISRYPIYDSDLICNHGNWQGKLEYAPRQQYGHGTEAIFEGLHVCIPEQYEKYLTQKYGDYTKEPPEQEQVGHHYCVICDVDRPYTDYKVQRSF